MNEEFKTLFVYKYASKEHLKDKISRFPQNFSTQKITGVFICFVIIGLALMVMKELYCSVHCISVYASCALYCCPFIFGCSHLVSAIISIVSPFTVWLLLHIFFTSNVGRLLSIWLSQLSVIQLRSKTSRIRSGNGKRCNHEHLLVSFFSISLYVLYYCLFI